MQRIHVAPWKSQTDIDTPLGAVPAVLAVSWGKGDVQRDPIHAVFVDSEGRMRDYTQLENFHTQQPRDEFVDLIRRRNPDVIVIGGFSMATTKLSQRIKEILDCELGVAAAGHHFSERYLDLPDVGISEAVAVRRSQNNLGVLRPECG